MHFGPQPDDEVAISYIVPNQPPHGGFPLEAMLSLKIPKANPQALSARQWVENMAASAANSLSSALPEVADELRKNMVDVTIDGVLAARTFTNLGGTQVLIPHNGKMYEIDYSYVSADRDSPFYERIFDHILSTFKFAR